MQSEKQAIAEPEKRRQDRRNPDVQSAPDATTTGPDGEERRQSAERRELPYGVLFNTSDPIVFVEDWLDGNCEGLWKLSLVEIDEELVRKSIRIEFERMDDKQAFIEAFSRR